MSAAHQAMETAATGHSHGDEGGELFTRGVQSTIGMGFGVVAFSIAMGALCSPSCSPSTYGRVGSVSARTLSVLVAGGMLISLWIVPRVEVSAEPTGDQSTTGPSSQRSLSCTC